MRFLSDILAKAGLIVDGAAVFNSSATGQTPATNDNSTKFATTAWVRSFVQPYTLPIASSTVLGGIKVGTGLAIDAITGVLSVSGGSISLKSTQTFTATAGQSIFTIANGYTVGLIDVFLNGVYLSPGQTTATNGSTVTLADPALAGDIIDVIITSPIGQGSIATTDSLPEGTVNLYYTPARVRAAISLTTTGVSGAATYNNATGVFNIPNYQGLVPAGGNSGQLLAKIDGSDYSVQWINEAPAASYTSQVKHQVKTSQAINKGQAVYVSSSNGTNMIVSKASNAAEATSSKTMGLLEANASANGFVNVIAEGLLSGLNTGTANAGDPVWLGTNGDLIYGLVNKPVAPAHLVFIGIVTRANTNNGEIFVKVQNGFELDELHDLSVKNASDGDMIKYVASTGLWTKIAASTTNIVEGTNLYYTNARVASYLTANSYATQGYVNTAISNLVASAPTTLDTLNELATALGNDPNFATTIATSIGTKVPQTRTITINGTAYDLSADRTWSIAAGVTSFNTRTGAITLTSGDVTGALTYTPVTNARTLTINGTAYDLSADRSWTITTSDATKLPLSGGTLTGALSGTSATFSSSVSSVGVKTNGGGNINIVPTSYGGNGFVAFRNTADSATRWNIYNYTGGGTTYGSLNFSDGGGTDRLVINEGGAATFSSTLNANGVVTITSPSASEALILNGTANSQYIAINSVVGAEAMTKYYNPTAGSWYTGVRTTAGLGSTSSYHIYSSVYSGGDVFVLNTDGSAKFATTITAPNGYLGGGLYLTTQGSANNTPSLPSVNAGVYAGVYAFIDLATQNENGSWIDFSKGDGGDYAGRIRYYANPERFGFHTAGGVEKITFDAGGNIVLLGGSSSSQSSLASGLTSIRFPNQYSSGYTDAGVKLYIFNSGSTIQGFTAGPAYDLQYHCSGSDGGRHAFYIANSEIIRFNKTNVGILTTNPLAPLHVNGDIRTTGLRLNQGTNNQGHRIYSRTMDVSAYSTQTSMRFTVAGGNNVQFQYEVTFHATRLSGTLAEIWYLRYTGGVVYDTAGNASERWWDLREQAGNGIAGVGRNNNTGNLEIHNSAFDTSCRLTVCVKITCNNWDAVTVSFS